MTDAETLVLGHPMNNREDIEKLFDKADGLGAKFFKRPDALLIVMRDESCIYINLLLRIVALLHDRSVVDEIDAEIQAYTAADKTNVTIH